MLEGEEWLEDTILVLVEREEETEVERGEGRGVEICLMDGRGAEGVGIFVSTAEGSVLSSWADLGQGASK